ARPVPHAAPAVRHASRPVPHTDRRTDGECGPDIGCRSAGGRTDPALGADPARPGTGRPDSMTTLAAATAPGGAPAREERA
ncbi:hypothetical protein, partial [Streptomyces spongiae]|uniref:hypothetical protein n=1 Tax=Streptomyces spongiae TaxID=565072 RepID=UPI001D13EB08